MESHHLYLLSNASNDLNENNTLTNFVCTLPTPLNLSTEHQWGVRVEALSFQTIFGNLAPSKAHLFLARPSDFKIKSKINIIQENENIIKIKLDANEYDIKSLISAIRLQVPKEMQNDVKLTSLNYHQLNIQGNNIIIGIEKGLYQSLGFPDRRVLSFDGEEYKVFEFVHQGQQMNTSDLSLYKRKPKYVKVLLDQVQPHPTSRGYQKDILTNTLESKSDDTTFYLEPTQRTLFPLSSHNINYIRIKLVDEEDRQLRVLPAQATVVQLNIAKMDTDIIPLSITSNDSDILFPSNSNSGERKIFGYLEMI